jgi:hypothetical protein
LPLCRELYRIVNTYYTYSRAFKSYTADNDVFGPDSAPDPDSDMDHDIQKIIFCLLHAGKYFFLKTFYKNFHEENSWGHGFLHYFQQNSQFYESQLFCIIFYKNVIKMKTDQAQLPTSYLSSEMKKNTKISWEYVFNKSAANWGNYNKKNSSGERILTL